MLIMASSLLYKFCSIYTLPFLLIFLSKVSSVLCIKGCKFTVSEHVQRTETLINF